MSLDAAKLWFDEHPHEIPAVEANISEIVKLLDEEYQAHNLVKFAVRDPGLILAILKLINANRGPESGLDVVESPQSAISMLGHQVTQTLFREFQVAENTLSDPEQIFLFQQIINRSYHNEFQAELWGKEKGFKQLDKLLLPALLAYAGELLCCLYDYEKYKDYALAGSTEQHAQQIFGFQFPELTEVVCAHLNLPELIRMLQPHTENVSQLSNLLHFTSQLCQLCEHGWYNEKINNALEQFSEYFQIPLDKVISKTHEFSVIAARASFIPEAWQPGSRLILTKDSAWKPKPRPKATAATKPSTVNSTKAESAADKIKRLLSTPGSSQSSILSTCVQGLHKDIGMGTVALLLVSKDKKHLQNRMTIGVDDSSPFKQFSIAIEQAGILKMLLGKPSAVWINATTFEKYQKLIPDSFSKEIKTNNFCIMSLFVGVKPIAILYADQRSAITEVDERSFSQFKQLITLTSKALTLLVKKQQSK